MKTPTTLFCAMAAGAVFGAVELGAPFKDGCVLQREKPLPVWGWASAGETVTVSFAGQTKTATAGKDGTWRVTLDPLKASSESRDLTVASNLQPSTSNLTIHDVLVGEVWFASGQSNMELPLWSGDPHRRDQDGCLVASMTEKPQVRFLKSPKRRSLVPEMRIDATWRKAVPTDMLKDSVWAPTAIGYYFAIGLEDAIRVPVAVVEADWGGTGIDAWTPSVGYEGKEGLDREKFWKAIPDAQWRNPTPCGPCGGPSQQPRVLWNGMVAAFTNMAIRGVLWYQGCENIYEPERYTAKMHALYDGWAKSFGIPKMPFYFSQLTPFGDKAYRDTLIMEAQERFYREEPNSGMAVICDRGNIHDCHPNDKAIVAKRLLAFALARQYGFRSVRPDPVLVQGWTITNNAFRIEFKNGRFPHQYRADFGVESGFEVAGADGVWHPGVIQQLRVKEQKQYVSRGCLDAFRFLNVSSPEVKEPKHLRYLYSGDRVGTIHFDGTHPLGPFHIDVK